MNITTKSIGPIMPAQARWRWFIINAIIVFVVLAGLLQSTPAAQRRWATRQNFCFQMTVRRAPAETLRRKPALHATYARGLLSEPKDCGKVGEPCASKHCQYLQRLSGSLRQPFEQEVSHYR